MSETARSGVQTIAALTTALLAALIAVDGNAHAAGVAIGWVAVSLFLLRWASLSSSAFLTWIHLWFVVHFLGVWLGWYATPCLFDKVVHAIVTAGFVFLLLQRLAVQSTFSSIRWQAAFAVSLALSSAAAWEFIEFGVDLTGYFQMQQGLTDTMTDMASALSGGIIGWLFLQGQSVLEARQAT